MAADFSHALALVVSAQYFYDPKHLSEKFQLVEAASHCATYDDLSSSAKKIYDAACASESSLASLVTKGTHHA